MPEKALYSPATVHSLLKRYHLKADKAFGQNFLIDFNILMSIVDAAKLQAEDSVLEVGPGLGVLSKELGSRVKTLTCVELDKRLLPVLEETLAGMSNITVLNQDALKFDFNSVPKESLFIANLPYAIASPLIIKALSSGQFKRIVVMVQKEVAERFSAKAKMPNYGALSLIISYFGKVKRIKNVKATSFFPAPKVTSSIVSIEPYPVQANPKLFDFIHTCFRHRRKTLQKNLLMASYDKDKLEQGLNNLNLDPQIRAEALDLASFTALYTWLSK